MAKKQKITLKNVRVHNLKSVNLELEANQLICFTGISGSGKSSLAFDTLYVEGQRRYVESLSAHARRFLGDLPKPDVESIDGISPTISIEQKTAGKNPRSTVGTLTEVYDYLRVLFARVAIPHCPVSGEAVRPRSVGEIIDELLDKFHHRQVILLSPAIRRKKGTLQDDIEELVKKGFTRARIDGEFYHLGDEPRFKKDTTHDLDIVIDRLTIDKANEKRLRESLLTALEHGGETAICYDNTTREEVLLSTLAFSPKSGLSYAPLDPHDFSFNSPQGMCPDCQGMGVKQEYELHKVIDPEKSISEDCCSVASSYGTVRYKNIYDNLARIYDFDVRTPWKELSEEAKKVFLYGTEKKWTRMHFVHPVTKHVWTDTIAWRGVLHEAYERYLQAKSDLYKRKQEKLMTLGVCPSCQGARIKPYPAAALLHGKKIQDLANMTIEETHRFFETIALTKEEAHIGNEIVKEIKERLQFLLNVGLEYLQLSRGAPTLSGGEAQRVRLASQIGSGLVGVTYILDEPSIGLHPRDNKKLIQSLKQLRDKGNTVIVVEHDEETIHAVDHIVDFGPKAGANGGEIIFSGSLQKLLKNKKSLTADYLAKRKEITIPEKRRPGNGKLLQLHGATHHNLKNVNVTLPLGTLVAVTGVSGSGKSSLFLETLYPALHNRLMEGELPEGKFSEILGIEAINKVIEIDQSPIGRTPRSNPATYISLFDDIRDLFAELPQSKAKGFKSGRFSFNVKEGSCSECNGMGMLKIEMDFLEDSFVTCPTCEGKRFDEETLQVRYREKNIQDILDMDVKEAVAFFKSVPHIRKKLELMQSVGLDYLKLGQASSTLSGGEAQRIKLARELVRPATGKTLYILDEPTTGLHFHDIDNLLKVLHALVDQGNSVCIIEHNMDLVKTADWVIDMGPESGDRGGEIIQVGTPEEIASATSATGVALREALQGYPYKEEKRREKPAKKEDKIIISKASQNNLKEISCEIEHGKMTCLIGPSGSGKSSLAFETIYAEGQRRYVESLSPYIRQFVKQLPKPRLEKIEGLSPTIAIEQRLHASNPRSTVGTMTEIYDYLRILYSRLGEAFCPKTGHRIQAVSKESIVEHLLSHEEGTNLIIMAPIELKRAANIKEELSRLQKLGFLRVRLNRKMIHLGDAEELPDLDSKIKNELLLVVDRVTIDPSIKPRLFEAVRVASQYGKKNIVVQTKDKDLSFNLSFSVPETGESYPEITPKTFAFNTQEGMCQTCQGIGSIIGFSIETLPTCYNRTARQLIELIVPEHQQKKNFWNLMEAVFKALEIDPDVPLAYEAPSKVQALFYGTEKAIEFSIDKLPFSVVWRGVNHALEHAFEHMSLTDEVRESLTSQCRQRTCPDCGGGRLHPLARHVLIQQQSIVHVASIELTKALHFIQEIQNRYAQDETRWDHTLNEVVEELIARLTFLIDMGLSYISLDRSAESLSGGEEQRVRLARQIGSGLTQVLYVLDEPTIGLHPHDVEKLSSALTKLKDLGNTLVIVEHDPQLIKKADHLLELGPGSGKNGGSIIYTGTPEDIQKCKHSATAPYLDTRRGRPVSVSAIVPREFLRIKDATCHNLQNVSVKIPLKQLVTLTGVSGSGKSTLLFDVLMNRLEPYFQTKKKAVEGIEGYEKLSKLVVVDQKPMSHTTRSDVATYLDLLTHMRIFFASLPEARSRGLEEKHFSYFTRSGMCKSCQGLGYKRVYLHFLPMVQITCAECKGLRLQHESLQVTYQNKNLGEILNLSAREVAELFHHHPVITRILKTLTDVGLDYLSLSQEMYTLSSGEQQRMKLAFALTKRLGANTLFLFDEPTTGLHPQEVEKILQVMRHLVANGNSVIAIEHNIDFIQASDWVIDIGPGAASEGGRIVAEGPPGIIAKNKGSITGHYL